MKPDDAHKILIVDDDPLVLESTSSLIRMWGYEAVPCHSAREAMEEYLKGGIDLVLSDIKMPDVSGVELLGMITDNNPNSRTAIFQEERHHEYERTGIAYSAGGRQPG